MARKRPFPVPTPPLPTDHPLWPEFVRACGENHAHPEITAHAGAFWHHGRLLWLFFVDGATVGAELVERKKSG